MPKKSKTSTLQPDSASLEHFEPLAALMRPERLEDFVGQAHLLGPNGIITAALKQRKLHSMILWGPPGTGKTTLARLLASQIDAHLESISAVLVGVKEIRDAAQRAKEMQQQHGRQTIILVDEIHRFNKSQQDAFLPYVEDGTLLMIGATTENPSFELNNALLSRARVYRFQSLTLEELTKILTRAWQFLKLDLDKLLAPLEGDILPLIAQLADGDARQALNYLEIWRDYAKAAVDPKALDLVQLLGLSSRRFDKRGDDFYDLISALHKAVRGSDPQAAIYWFTRMVDGGCDYSYLARRLIRMASEDVGNADPRALILATSAAQAYERLGSPEGELALAQAIIYMSVAPKSNATYVAFNLAKKDVEHFGSLPVPLHIRNAPTKLMKQEGYGKNYRYPHDEPNAFAAGEVYLPKELLKKCYYRPTNRGLEEKIAKKLAYLQQLNQDYQKQHQDKPRET